MPADPRGPARSVYADLGDRDSVRAFGEDIEPGNPIGWPGYPGQLAAAELATGSRHAVLTSRATIRGEPCVLIGFDFGFIGGSAGVAEGTKVSRAFDVATTEQIPVVCVAATGGARMQEGTSALVQMQAFAAAVAKARGSGVPYIAVAADPTTGGVWSSLIACADVLIGVSGARVSFSGSRTRPPGADPDSQDFLADGKWERGFVDVLTPASGVRSAVAAAVHLLSPRSRGALARAPLPRWPPGAELPEAGPAEAAAIAWAQVCRARGPGRARADQWLADYFAETLDLRGDRCGGVDDGMRCGIGRHLGATVAYIAQTGVPTTAAGFRMAARVLGLASRLRLPVLTLIDTPGAAAQPAQEAAGIGTAIAELLLTIAASPVPITSVVIGEGVSGGAVALASPTDLWIAEGGYLAVTAPELATSILKLRVTDVPAVTEWLRLTPADLLASGIVRGIIGPGGIRSRAGQTPEPR